MKRLVTLTCLLAVAATAAPLAIAEYDPDKPPCPEGQMCTTSVGYGDDSLEDDNKTEPVDAGSTCMDGEQANETCRDDVQYIGGPPSETNGTDAPNPGGDGAPVGYTSPSSPASPENPTPSDADTQADPVRDAPTVGVAVVVGAFAAMAVFVGRRHP